jgi:hypothetical protein
MISRLGQQDAGAEELAAKHGGIANSLKELVLRRGPQDRFVCGAKRRKHPRNVRPQNHRFHNRFSALRLRVRFAGLSGSNELESTADESFARTTTC